MVNEGWFDEENMFSDDEAFSLMNEFCHVIRYQSDGNQRTIYKPVFSDKMALEIVKHYH